MLSADYSRRNYSAWVYYVCGRKRRFPDRAAAQEMLMHVLRYTNHPGDVLTAYCCPVDPRHWHYGHPPGTPRR